MAVRCCVLDMPGLTGRMLDGLMDAGRCPAWLSDLVGQGRSVIEPVLPAVTMPVQATYTTGVLPEVHGVIANGLASFRDPSLHEALDLAHAGAYRRQVSFWEQSNALLQVPRIWQGSGRQVALICLQSSMGAGQYVVTPKPEHHADGRTVSHCWTSVPGLNVELARRFGPFPLKHYWGPLADISSSRWIVQAGGWLWSEHAPDLLWSYLPHLDYDLQRLGPSDPKMLDALADLLQVVEPLVLQVQSDGGRLVVVSEYGMTDVSRSLAPNVVLRGAGLLVVDGAGDVDYQQSAAFAMCDHQVAHVYVRDSNQAMKVERLLSGFGEVAAIYRGADRGVVGLDCDRAGDLVVLAASDAWFEYRWFEFGNSSHVVPDYAWQVDIHRKPGYDPLEMFFDPSTRRIRADAPELVRGSHGVKSQSTSDWPVLLGVAGVCPVVSATDLAGLW